MKRTIFTSLFLCFSTLMGVKAYALPIITLTASNDIINSQYVTAIDISITGLGNHSSPSLGAFSLDLIYNPNFLTPYLNPQFGSSLGDEGIGEALTYSSSSIPGSIPMGLNGVYIDEISLLFDFELDAIQSDSFNLATLYFREISYGYAFLAFDKAILSDADGNTITSPNQGGGMLIKVPEPMILSLLSIGLLGISCTVKKRKVVNRLHYKN